MIKQSTYSYQGLNQDITKSKHSPQFYFDAKNIRIISTDDQSTGSVTNEKGNEEVMSIPDITINKSQKKINYLDKEIRYKSNEISNLISSSTQVITDQIIINHTITREDLIIFSTNSNGVDCIWKIKNIFNSDYELELIYIRNLKFSIEKPIQALFNYESDIIQKVYWVDGDNQLSFINIEHSIANGDSEDLIDLDSNSLLTTGRNNISQPQVVDISQGGIHTSGMIQYAYSLYKLNASQTTISPLSKLVPLDKGNSAGGGEVNEEVGSSPLIQINDLDPSYSNIRLYAIKYTSFNQEPQVSLIVDEEINNYNSFQYFDNGSVITNLSLSEFIFLGTSVITPKHIASKDNRLFAASLVNNSFNFDIDTRAYSFSASRQALVWDDITVNNNVPTGIATSINTTTYSLPKEHNAINIDYDVYRYQSNGTTLGGEGKFLKYEIVQKSLSQLEEPDLKLNQFFKDREIYRLGIQFYNSLGQLTAASWIADFKAPTGNLNGNYNTLKVELKETEINNYINSLNLTGEDVPVGYKILRADRQANDRTILCQGNLTGMMVQTTKNVRSDGFWTQGDPLGFSTNRRDQSLQDVKLPLIVNRSFPDANPIDITPVTTYTHLRMLNEGFDESQQEIMRENARAFKTQQTWQYLKMFQLYSPDVLFNTGLSFPENSKLRVIGGIERQQSSLWAKGFDLDSGSETANLFNENTNTWQANPSTGLYGPGKDSNDDRTTDIRFTYMYNEYANLLTNNILEYEIYGKPELTERGQNITSYKGDSNFKYRNSLQDLLSDAKKEGEGSGNADSENALVSANALGARCVTLVEGIDSISENQRRTLVDLYNAANLGNNDVLLLGEIVLPRITIYTGNIYGGNTYESKTRGSYIEIGSYKKISEPVVQIDSPGDTFVQDFNFGRILKADTERFAGDVHQLSEVIKYPVETSINLLNRNDKSIFGWDNDFQPRDDEYHKYNRVYSQQPTIIQNQSESFNFKESNSFDTRIISSKLKIPGESIDSWTDFLENEVADLDGKYGPINNMINYRDNIYALQDQGVAKLNINPNVQIQGSDGIDLELGKGSILYDYNYLTTNSGTVNKWSVLNSGSAFYYLDALNKKWLMFNGSNLTDLTDSKGLHTFFNNNINYQAISLDNPFLNQGVSTGFDFLNRCAYLTVNTDLNNAFTLNFNELTGTFESFHDYTPSLYMYKGNKIFTTNPENNSVYEQNAGEYQTFYGVKYPSSITLMVNPNANLDCVFNNIMYKSEIYLDNIDQPDKTLSHISAWNEYQSTGRIELVLGRNKNLRRKFRNWMANIPRDGRKSIRNPWIYLKLELDTETNLKMILHDIIVGYTIY